MKNDPPSLGYSESFREQAGVAGEIRMSNDEGITKFGTRF
jgi:hypothetical protein